MGLLIKENEMRTLEIRKKTLKGLLLKFFATALNNNVAIATAPIDLSKVSLSCSITRNGQKVDILKDKLQPIAMHGSYMNAAFEDAKTGTATVVRDHAANVKAQVLQMIYVDFGGPINIKDEDAFVITVEILDGAIADGVDAGVSYIQMDEVETVELELYLPITVTKSISPGESTNKYFLGDNVNEVTFINCEDRTIKLADKVIESVNFTSDKVAFQDNYLQMLAKRNAMFQTKGDAEIREQSFLLAAFNDLLLNNVVVDISFNSSNVASGKNFLVYRKFLASPEALQRYKNKQEQHFIQHVHDISK